MGETGSGQQARCLEENTLDALIGGRLSPAEREHAALHLDACDDCRLLLAALGHAASSIEEGRAEAETPEAAARPSSAVPSLLAGSRIGRYTVLHAVGAGGMGVVFAAYDPELDRRVALKLVHQEVFEAGQREEAASRLMREAQALARLSHPHVITVFDAGRFDEQVFLTMEFIEGGTLGQWLRAESRSPDAALRLLLEAGRGLSAAHAAGLVHRDFKPDNVLLGQDGRARVTDFGLARVAAGSGPEPDGHESAIRPLPAGSGTRTHPGALLGTPAYMAPELWRGAPADARSDQFAYCVALYEALQGTRPFSVGVLSDQTMNLESWAPPRGNRVPLPLQGALARGLAARPEQRFPSMTALLAALERGMESPRKRRWTRAAALGVVALALTTFGAVRWRDRGLGVCAHAEDRLVGAWDEGRKSQLRAAFLATGAPYAGAAWSGTEALLDRYAGSWVQMHTETCEATQVRGEQSGELLDLRMACLAQRREGLRALTSVLAAADKEVVSRAVQAAGQLPSLEECASRLALTEPLRLPQDPAARARIEGARARLAEAAAELSAGRYELSRTLASKVSDEARSLAYKPLEAEAFMAVAIAHVRLEDSAGAEPLLYRALTAAQASGHLMIAARADLSLAFVHGLMLRRHPQGHVWVDLAQATIERIGDAPLASAQHLVVLGNLLLDEGHAGEARSRFEQALALQERLLGPEHLEVAKTLGRLAATLATLERYPEAVTAAQRSLDINERLLGPDHRSISISLHAFAFILVRSGRRAEAIPSMQRALSIEERAFGPDHPGLVKTLINLSNVHRVRDPSDSIALLERARAIQERSVGAEHPDMIFILQNLANTHGSLRRYEEQLSYGQRALALNEKLLGPDHPDLTATLTLVGQAHSKLGEPARGLPFLERALALSESRPFTDSYSIGRGERVNLREQLADALWSVGRDRKRARDLVAGALTLSRGGGPEMAENTAKLEGWLSAHPL